MRATQRVPGLGRHGQVPTGPLALGIVVQPPSQPGPRASQGFVRELDALVIADDEPSGDQQLDQPLVLLVRRDPALGEVAAHGLSLVGRGHQAEQEISQCGLLLRPYPLVDLLGGLRDGATDATGRPVAGDRERPALTS